MSEVGLELVPIAPALPFRFEALSVVVAVGQTHDEPASIGVVPFGIYFPVRHQSDTRNNDASALIEYGSIMFNDNQTRWVPVGTRVSTSRGMSV